MKSVKEKNAADVVVQTVRGSTLLVTTAMSFIFVMRGNITAPETLTITGTTMLICVPRTDHKSVVVLVQRLQCSVISSLSHGQQFEFNFYNLCST
jgi:hypothetical protein